MLDPLRLDDLLPERMYRQPSQQLSRFANRSLSLPFIHQPFAESFVFEKSLLTFSAFHHPTLYGSMHHPANCDCRSLPFSAGGSPAALWFLDHLRIRLFSPQLAHNVEQWGFV